MAKNNNYKNRQNNRYNGNGDSKAKNGIIGVIAAVTASALILSAAAGVMGYGTNGFKDWSFNNFSHKTEYTAPVEETGGGALLSDNVESNGISLMSARVAPEEYADYGIDTQSVENVFNLSVTYVPENTTFQETTYTIAFKNPNSTWAKGKNVTDYVTVTQSAIGSKDAQLTVKKAFSEQIIVTATSERNSSLYATTTVDYLCEYPSLILNHSDGSITPTSDIEVKGRWLSGTIIPEIDGHMKLIIDFSPKFVQHMSTYGFTVKQYYTHILNEDEFYGDSALSHLLYMLRNVGDYNSLSSDKKAAYDNALGTMYAGYDDGDLVGYYDIVYERVYNGKLYGDAMPSDSEIDSVKDDLDWGDVQIFCAFSDTFEVRATNMNTNNGHIVAG